MKYSIVTFGCRVNQADSLRLDEDLQGLGWVERPMTDADVVVVNTCSVTATADQGARQTIRRIARENPTARIVATGCYATRCSDDLLALPGVVRVVRNDDKLDLVRILDLAAVAPEATLTSERDGDGPCGARLEPGTGGRTTFTLRVQTGCEEACTYCIIPMTRGASRSMPPEGVVREVERIAAAGYREIVLTGVHLGSYRYAISRRRSPWPRCSELSTVWRQTSAIGSARWSRWTALQTSWISSRPRTDSSRTSICRCSTRATGC